MNLENIKNYAELTHITMGKKSDIALPYEVVQFLKGIGDYTIMLDWSAENIKIYGEHDIYEMQKIYSNALDLVVIGDIISNPIFFNKDADYRVQITKHGIGELKLQALAKNLDEFIEIINIYINEYYSKFDQKILNDDFEVLEEFKSSLRDHLLNIADNNSVETFISFL